MLLTIAGLVTVAAVGATFATARQAASPETQLALLPVDPSITGSIFAAAFSASGQQVIFEGRKPQGNSFQYSLFAVHPDGSGILQLSPWRNEPIGFGLTESVRYVIVTQSGLHSQRVDLVTGRHVGFLTRFDPIMAPDGSVYVKPGSSWAFRLLSPAGTSTQLRVKPSGIRLGDLTFVVPQHSGDFYTTPIAWCSQPQYPGNVWSGSTPPAGGAVVTLTKSDDSATNGMFTCFVSRDGSVRGFSDSNKTSRGNLNTVTVYYKGRIVRLRAPDRHGYTSGVVWDSPSGRYGTAGGGTCPSVGATFTDRVTVIYDALTSRSRMLRPRGSPAALYCFNKVWSQDSTRFAVGEASPNQGAIGLEIVTAATGARVLVRVPKTPPGYQVEPLQWIAQSNRVVFEASSLKASRLYSVRADGSGLLALDSDTFRISESVGLGGTRGPIWTAGSRAWLLDDQGHLGSVPLQSFGTQPLAE